MADRIGSYRHRVTLDEPGPVVGDPDGGWVASWVPLDPSAWDCAIEMPPARPRDMESIGGGTILAQATHLLKGRYHKGITTQTRVTYKGRTMNVIYVANRDERDIESVLLCAEVIA